MDEALLQEFGTTINPPLASSRLILEPLTATHAPLLYEPLQDPVLYLFMPQDPPADIDWLKQRYEKLAARFSPGGTDLWLNWAVRTANDPTHYVGYLQAGASLTSGDNTSAEREAYLAYIIFATEQRRGYAYESCCAVRDYLLNVLGADSITALIDTRNTASIGLIESLGFVREAFLPQADFFKGCSSDEYRYRYRKNPVYQVASSG